jgi:hypothetical protein
MTFLFQGFPDDGKKKDIFDFFFKNFAPGFFLCMFRFLVNYSSGLTVDLLDDIC